MNAAEIPADVARELIDVLYKSVSNGDITLGWALEVWCGIPNFAEVDAAHIRACLTEERGEDESVSAGVHEAHFPVSRRVHQVLGCRGLAGRRTAAASGQNNHKDESCCE